MNATTLKLSLATASLMGAMLLSTAALAVELDDRARPTTWESQLQLRNCDPNEWDAPVNSNVWTNWTCDRIANGSLENRRDRIAARKAAEEENGAALPTIPGDDVVVIVTPAPTGPTNCNGAPCAPGSGPGNSEGNEQSANDGD